MAGENSAACAKATRSAGVFAWQLMAGAARPLSWMGCGGSMLVEWRGGAFGGVDRVVGGMTHNPSAFLGQCSSLPLGRVMVHCSLVKVT